MSLNYTNFDTQANVFPGYTINYFPPNVRLRDIGGITSYDYAWGKNIGTGSAGTNWLSSLTSINYYGNNSGSSTTSYDITFKKDPITNVYTYVFNSTNFNTSTNPTNPINDSGLNLWNDAGTALYGKKVTDINFFYMPMRFKSASGQTATMTISNYRINNNAVTIQNNSSISLTSINEAQQNLNLFIPIQQITGDFNIKFDLTLPQISSLNTSQENSRIWLQFGQAIPLSISTISLSYGYVNSGYNQTLVGIGGTTPYTWSITTGSLPLGLTLNSSTGAISGTPNGTAGTSTFTVTITDANNFTATKELSIIIYDELTIGTLSPLNNGTTDSPYFVDLDESGGLVPYTWSIIDGVLPTDLTINPSTGIISGTPTVAGIFNFEAQLLDQNNVSVTREYTITISALEEPICYIGSTKVLAKDIEIGEEAQVCVKDITPEKYLVFSVTQQKFVPVRVNCISGSTDKFILIKKDLLDENKPSQDFYVTPAHPILYKNCEILAKNIIGAQKATLKKQLIYTLVTDNREALAINNIDVICWEHKAFMKKYKKSKNAVWIENENMHIINKF